MKENDLSGLVTVLLTCHTGEYMYININVKSSHVIGYLHLYVMRIEPHLLMVSKKSCSIEKYYE